jgi:predicted alpha-1,6-mannanase (GH76 family)
MAVVRRKTAFSIAVALSILVLGGETANAQTAANADAVYSGWLKAYLVTSGSKTYFANGLSDRSMAFMWQQAYLITGVEDAYDENRGADRQQLVSALLTTFEAQNHADLSWDSWDDDVAWATIALVRGYQITSNMAFLSDATQAWNMAYDRGWDTKYGGGGIWENLDDTKPTFTNRSSKCALSTAPFVFTGVTLYQITGDATYLTKAEGAYTWLRKNLYDSSTGVVNECLQFNSATDTTGHVDTSDNSYNGGLLLEAAAALYHVTGTASYHDDAVTEASHVMTKEPITNQDHPANGSFAGDQFFRGLGTFARENGLWPQYQQWLENNAAAAWEHRRTDYNVSQNNFTQQTPATGDILSMETEGSVVVQMVFLTGPSAGDAGVSDAGDDSKVDGGAAAEAGDDDASPGQGANDAGSTVGAGASDDAGSAGQGRSTASDAGSGAPSGSSGCGCVAAGAAPHGTPHGTSGALALLALTGALAMAGRRSRR